MGSLCRTPKPKLADLKDALVDNEKFSEFSNAFVPIRSLLTRPSKIWDRAREALLIDLSPTLLRWGL